MGIFGNDFDPDKFMRKFEYDDQRITHLLNTFDHHVYFIRDYDNNFKLDDKHNDRIVLAGYMNSAFGILLSLFQLGYLTTMDFHMRLHALNTVFFRKVKV